MAFDVHQYLDSDSSGLSDVCVSSTIGSERLTAFTQWLRQYNRRGFLTEFSGGRNSTCYDALDDMIGYVNSNSDVWLGWTYWAAGPWWGDYIFTLEPENGRDRPQMSVLQDYLVPRYRACLPAVLRNWAPTPTPTVLVYCTPPPCNFDEGEVYHCPSTCPGGCGTICATVTPAPAPVRE
jgi:hypothetical protein